jgi:REP element-mobilizing transposase RayT
MSIAACAVALECWVKQSGRKFELHAVVVMPDPVHWIYSPLPRSDGRSYSLPEIMKAIKGRSAREINVAIKPSCSG